MHNGFRILLVVYLASVSLCLTAQNLPAGIQDLKMMTEEFPPYNFLEGTKPCGTSIDIMALICQRLKLEPAFAGLQILPWPRAYKRLLHEPNTVLFAMTRTKEREKLFKWVGPISTARNVLLARKDRHIRLAKLAEARNYRIGVIPDDAGEQLLLQAGVPATQLDAAQDARSNLLKLHSGRIDLFAYDLNVSLWLLKNLGFDPADFEVVLPIQDGEHYFAFNCSTDNAIIQAFQRELDSLKHDGSYRRIMNHYLRN